MKKKIIWILVLLVVLYSGFVVVDCVRLRYGAEKPLVTVKEEVTEFRTTYQGLGYSVCHYIDAEVTEENGTTYIAQYGYGAEFRWFGMMIWAWVE